MSHALVIVALDNAKGVEAAVERQMAPFDENGSLRVVQAAAAKVESEAEPQLPVRVTKARTQPTRLTPPQQDRLRERRLDLQARFRIETDDNTILQQFFDEAFDRWVKDKLAAKDGANGGKGSK